MDTSMDENELTLVIDDHGVAASERAAALVERGRLRWKRGDMRGALGDYNAAAELDPEGPGAELAAHTVEILNFYNHDLYNP